MAQLKRGKRGGAGVVQRLGIAVFEKTLFAPSSYDASQPVARAGVVAPGAMPEAARAFIAFLARPSFRLKFAEVGLTTGNEERRYCIARLTLELRRTVGARLTLAVSLAIGCILLRLNPTRRDCSAVQFNLRLILTFLLEEYLSPSVVNHLFFVSRRVIDNVRVCDEES